MTKLIDCEVGSVLPSLELPLDRTLIVATAIAFRRISALAAVRSLGTPVRYGTWFWGLGMASKIFVPKKTGANWEITEEMEALRGVQKHINVLTNFTAFRDTYQNLCHYTGWVIQMSGSTPQTANDKPGESIDRKSVV